MSCGAHSIVARMESREPPLTVGQTLQVELKMPKTHLFDKDTSQTIV
jgi:multiple sugar transport system ATP-binding protein